MLSGSTLAILQHEAACGRRKAGRGEGRGGLVVRFEVVSLIMDILNEVARSLAKLLAKLRDGIASGEEVGRRWQRWMFLSGDDGLYI